MYTELLSQFLNKNNSHYIINKVSQKMDDYVYGKRKKDKITNKALLRVTTVHCTGFFNKKADNFPDMELGISIL